MSGSPQLQGMVFCGLPQAVRHLVGRLLLSVGIKKKPFWKGPF
ncbi:hypothetical protein SynBIOSE41_04476 [Synechococcus sp. BIOS-E4-1]|nr:hypothetical protein SynBIOSE41_04476 [Synechococcus sp. BIOS-E4-1]